MTDILDCSTTEKSESGAKMFLLAPGTKEALVHQGPKDKAPRPMYLTIQGPESKAVQKALAAINARMVKAGDEDGSFDESRYESDRVADSQLLAGITVGGEVFMGGKWVNVNTDNAYDIYYAVLAFRNQAVKFAFDLGNFTKG